MSDATGTAPAGVPRSTRSRAARATCCPTRCASCARSPTRVLEVFERGRLRRGPDAGARVRGDARARRRARRAPAYRVFDEKGRVLVLRSDMTVPIARLVATRYADAEPPLRFCYFAHGYRGVRPQRGQPREFLQAGIELIGAPAPEGTAEALTVLCRALDAPGWSATASASATRRSTRRCSTGSASRSERRERLLAELVSRRLRRPRARVARARARRRAARAAAARAADARRAGGAPGPGGPVAGARGGPARRARAARAGASPRG